MSKKLKITIVTLICISFVVMLALTFKLSYLINNSPPSPGLDVVFDAWYDTDGIRYMSEDEIFFFDITDGKVTNGGIKSDNQIVKTAVLTEGNLISVYALDDVEKSRLLLSGKCYYVSHESDDIRLVINESVLDCDELVLYHNVRYLQ